MELLSISSKVFNTNIVQTVNARELHQFLGSRQQFIDWIQGRINKYGFVENQDFIFSENTEKSDRCRPKEYFISLEPLNMAKELYLEEKKKGEEAPFNFRSKK